MSNVNHRVWPTQSTHRGIEERDRGFATLDGKTWPCTIKSVGAQTVTVAFEGVSPWSVQTMTIPIAQSRYQRLPLQVGDQGLAMSASTYIGGVSGVGGTASLTRTYGNLSRLVFVPVSSRAWSAPADPNSHLIQGPSGVTLQTEDGTGKAVLTSSSLVLTFGGQTITFSAAGIVVTEGDVVVGGTHISSVNHMHTSEAPGEPTSPPIAGT